MASSFQKKSVTDQLVVEFRRAIYRGRWSPGSRLPTIRELAKQYSASLNTVHSAIQQLVADDLIECRPRQGGFVKARVRMPERVTGDIPRQVAVIRPLSPDEDPRDNWTGPIIRAAEHTLSATGCQLLLLPLPDKLEDLQTTFAQLESLHSHLVGIIGFPVGVLGSALISELSARDVPWISVNRADSTMMNNFVCPDYIHGGEMIGRALARNGVDEVLILGLKSVSNYERYSGILKGYWADCNRSLKITYLQTVDWREDSGYQAMRECLQAGTRPPVVVTTGDWVAIGAIKAIREHGLRVPEDIGVIGTTGSLAAGYCDPPLTVFQQPMEAIGLTAAEMLLGLISQGSQRISGRFVRGRMQFRTSFRVADDLREELEREPAGATVRDAHPPVPVAT